MMRTCVVMTALIALCLTPMSAQVQIDLGSLPDELRPVCAAAQEVPTPSADLPTVADRARLRGCNPLLLYRGDPDDTKGLTPNYTDARKCAYLAHERDFQWKRYYTVLGESEGGPGVTDEPLETLSLVYANAKGVPLNLDLAIRFTCEKGKGREEVNLEIQRLVMLKSKPGPYVGICEQASAVYDPCAGLELVPKWQKYNRELDAFTAHFSQQERQALASLSEAEVEYFWLDHSMYDHPQDMNMPEYDFEMKDGFLGALKAAEKNPPHFTSEDFRKADAALNNAYRQALQASNEYFSRSDVDTDEPKADRIRDAERAWLKDREAWVSFGSVKWPHISADSWRTWLTLQRTAELKDLARELTLPH